MLLLWLILVLAVVVLVVRNMKKSAKVTGGWSYDNLKKSVEGVQLPAMFVDIGRFDENIDAVKEIARKCGKTIRVGTKSIRVPLLIKRALDRGGPQFSGLLVYNVKEAEFLAEEIGCLDSLVAYPVVHEGDIILAHKMTQNGIDIKLMVDSVSHVSLLEKIISAQISPSSKKLKVCIDIDVSYRPFPGVHLGVLRSPIHSSTECEPVLQAILSSKHLQFSSVMGYEAQITVPDFNSPAGFIKDKIVSVMKNFSIPDVSRKRDEIVKLLKKKGIPYEFFNGGGSSTVSSTMHDKSVTEITIGSALLQSHIFDYQKFLYTKPSFFFGLQVSRIPQPGIATCQSGGFIASGSISPISNPIIILPNGVSATDTEGFGEVQTPVSTPKNIPIGDPIFLRPAKSGEIAERFNLYYVLENGKIQETMKTYRGHGKCFF